MEQEIILSLLYAEKGFTDEAMARHRVESPETRETWDQLTAILTPLEGGGPGAGGRVWGGVGAGRLLKRLPAGRPAADGLRQGEHGPGGDAPRGVKCVQLGHGKEA